MGAGKNTSKIMCPLYLPSWSSFSLLGTKTLICWKPNSRSPGSFVAKFLQLKSCNSFIVSESFKENVSYFSSVLPEKKVTFFRHPNNPKQTFLYTMTYQKGICRTRRRTFLEKQRSLVNTIFLYFLF